MADEIVSKLGLDASDVINTLNQLAAGFTKYTNALAESAGGTANFNSAQKQFVDLLARLEIQAKLTAGAIKDLNGGVSNTGKQLAAAATVAAQNAAASAAGQLKTQFDLGKATPEQLTGFTAALQTFQTRAAKAGLDAATLNKIVSNTGQTFNGAAAGVNQAALNVIKAGQAFGQIPGQVTPAAHSINNFSFGITRLIEVFTFQQLLRGVGALTGALASSIPQAIEFEKKIAAIATISDKSDQNLQTLETRLIGLANEFGKPAPEVAAGFYQALSNQVGNTDQTLQFFVASLKLARGTLADVGDAVNALSGIQLSYGESSAQAARNADILFTIVDLGRVSTKELGDSLGRITPLSAQLGVSLEEVGAAISVATQKGVNFRDAQTQILNLLTAALKPTQDFKKRLDELGFASAEAGIAAKGFIGFFTAVSEGAKSSAELAKLFQNIRGLRGEISLFGDQGRALSATLDDIQARAGAAQKAFETIQFTNAVQVESELNRVKNTLIAGFGHDVVAALAAANKAFGGFSNTLVNASEAIAAVLGIAVASTLANQTIAALTSLSSAFGIAQAAALSYGVVAVGAIAAVTTAVLAFNATDFAGKTAADFEKLRRLNAETGASLAEQVRQANQSVERATQQAAAAVVSGEARKQQAFNQSHELAARLQAADTTSLDAALNGRLRLFTSFFTSVKKLEDDQAANTLRLQETQRKTELDINQTQFERFNKQFDQEKQATNLAVRFASLTTKAQAAFNAGDIKVGEDILGILGGIATKHADITGRTILENRFIELTRIATQKQIDLQSEQVAAAKKLEAANEPTINAAREKIELAQGLLKELDKVEKAGTVDIERRDTIRNQIIGILGDIDKLGGKLTLGNLRVGDIKGTEVQNAVDALRKAIGGVPLQFQAEAGFKKLDADVRAFFEANPLVVGVKFEPRGFADTQKQAQDLLKATEAGFRAEEALPTLRLNVGASKINLRQNFTDIFKSLEEQQKAVLFTSSIFDRENINAQFDKVRKQFTDFEKGVEEIVGNPINFDKNGNLTASALKALDALNSPLRETQKQLAANNGGLAEFLGKFGERFSATLSGVIDGTKQLTISVKALQEAENAVEAGNRARVELGIKAQELPATPPATETSIKSEEEFDRAVKDAAESVKNLQTLNQEVSNSIVADEAVQAESINNLTIRTNLLGQTGFNAGIDASSGLEAIGSTALAQIPAVFALISALSELNSVGGGGGGVGEFASRGGPIFFANGGFAPRGKDTIPAFLSPGEFVMNPASSRKFFSQLVAMNAGVTPTFNSGGGAVSNTFGDIHVNVTAGASGIDGREIASAIRRELRRGTTRL